MNFAKMPWSFGVTHLELLNTPWISPMNLSKELVRIAKKIEADFISEDNRKLDKIMQPVTIGHLYALKTKTLIEKYNAIIQKAINVLDGIKLSPTDGDHGSYWEKVIQKCAMLLKNQAQLTDDVVSLSGWEQMSKLIDQGDIDGVAKLEDAIERSGGRNGRQNTNAEYGTVSDVNEWLKNAINILQTSDREIGLLFGTGRKILNGLKKAQALVENAIYQFLDIRSECDHNTARLSILNTALYDIGKI